MASLTALPALGHPALAFAARFEDQYRHAIAQAEMPRPDMKLTVLDFTAGTDAGETTLTAIVEMEWTPGFRKRKIVAKGEIPDFVLSDLINATLDEFRGAASN